MTFCVQPFENGTWVCPNVSLWSREKQKTMFPFLS